MRFSDNNSVVDDIRSVMEITVLNPPADHTLLSEVERGLGVPVPEWLRTIYLACNGFRGPTGVQYLYFLTGCRGVLEFTLLLRDQEWSPAWLNRAIVFGDNGIGGTSTVHWATLDGELIEWCLGDGPEFTTLDDGLFALWMREQAY